LIYGKDHFGHLSKKLDQKIQRHRYQNIIHSLDITKKSNDFFISKFLLLLKTQVAVPGEIIFYEGNISKGLYILETGTVELFSNRRKKLHKKVTAIDYFGLDVLMTKTGRHWCTALTRGYADLHIIRRKDFELLIE
jgi:CRP-like cAMP-binding protein